MVPAGGKAAEEVQLLQVSDEAAASKYADSVAAGTPKTSDYRNVPVSVDRRGLATAIVGGFLAIGRDSGVASRDRRPERRPGTGSLADDPKATAARDALPAERLADAYLSPDGIAKLVGNPRGPLATLDAAVDPTASDGVAMALVADDQGHQRRHPLRAQRGEGQGPARVLRRVPGVRADAGRLAPRRLAGVCRDRRSGTRPRLAARAGQRQPAWPGRRASRRSSSA